MTRLFTAVLCFAIGCIASSLFAFLSDPQIILPVQPLEIQAEAPPPVARPVPPLYLFDSAKNGDGFDGWFVVDEFRGMSEVWAVLLTSDYTDEADTRKWTAMMMTSLPDGSLNERDDFSAKAITADGRRLSFTTKTSRGIHYTFEGEFIKPGRHFEQEEKVLRGTLTKYRKDKMVARFTSDFAYAEPHCIH